MTWQKLNVLVPDPDCDTDDGVITAWRDARPQPTQAAIDAVTQTQVDALQLVILRNRAKTRADIDIFDRALVSELLFEINKLNTRMEEIHDAMAAMKATTGGTQNLRDGIPGSFLGITKKLRSKILQGIIDRIDAGEGDT